MKKRLLTMVLALTLVLSLGTPVFAAKTESMFSDLLDITNVLSVEWLGFGGLQDIREELGVEDDIYSNENIYKVKAKGPVTVTLREGPGARYGGGNIFEYAIYSRPGVDIDVDITEYEAEYSYLHETEASKVPAYKGTVTFDKPGVYFLYFNNNSPDGSEMDCEIYLYVEGGNDSTGKVKPTPSKLEAKPTASTVLVNGTPTIFEAYNINNNNYFKLRDLAQAVNNTEKNFEVEWDGSKNAINLVSNKVYTPAGGELAKGDNKTKNATLTTSAIYKDGKEVKLTAYNINDNNFFKLRDIAEAFNIGITWDGATSTIGIDTSIAYVAE